MRKFGLVVVLATQAGFAAAAASAQGPDIDDCEAVVIVIYENSIKSGGVCQGEGDICVDFYLLCDGQPWPFPQSASIRPDRGHLVTPELHLTAIDGNDRQSGAGLAFASASFCEESSLFERLDRKQEPSAVVKTTGSRINSAFTTPSVP